MQFWALFCQKIDNLRPKQAKMGDFLTCIGRQMTFYFRPNITKNSNILSENSIFWSKTANYSQFYPDFARKWTIYPQNGNIFDDYTS